jgi:hypothetical protein
MTRNQPLLVTLVATGAVLASFAAQADSPAWRDTPLGDRFAIELAAFYVITDTEVFLEDSKYPGPGLFIDLEDSLDLDDGKTIPLVFAKWRFTERNTLRYVYWDLERSSNNNFDIDLGTIGGEPFGPSIRGDFDIATHQLSYTYSFVFNAERDFYAGVGLSYMDIDLALVDEGGFLDPVKESVGAPVPAFVIGYDWAFRPDWVWRNTASAMAMALAINDDDDMEGYASSLSSTVEWRATRYLSVTAGYDFYQLDAEYDRSRKRQRWKLDYFYHGPRLGLLLRF